MINREEIASSASLNETFSDITLGETPVLVDFFAEWCGPCKLMQPILEELRKNMGEKIRILKVEVDKSPLVSSVYNVTGVPTLILFKKGNILWRQAGVVPAAVCKKLSTTF